MGFIKKSKNLPLCLALGIFCFLYAAARSYIEANVTLIETGLFLIAFACVLTCFVSMQSFTSDGSSVEFEQRILLTRSLILSVILYAALNWLGAHYKMNFDMTVHKQHTLSKETKGLLKNINKEIHLTSLYVGLAPKYLEDLLKEYENISSKKITFEIIDPLKQIGYAAQFGQVIKGREQKLIVQAGSERQDIDFTDEPLTEDLINNALIKVTRKARQACFLTGHGEYRLFDKNETGLNTFAQLLVANNVIPHEFSPALVGSIPNNCDFLVIAGPKENYSEKEEKIITDYLLKGGDALFLIENTVITTPEAPLKEDQLDKNPSLNNILKNWGMRINSDIVVDLLSHASGDVGSPATRNYPQHKAIVSGLDYTFYVRPRSISVIPDRRNTVKLAPLVLTASSDKSWGETNRMLDVKYDAAVDRPGPVPIAFVAWEPKRDKMISDTRLSIFTDADFASNAYISQLSNAQMALNIINWISDLDYQAFTPHKTIKVEEIHLVSKQKRMVVVILWIIPCIIATLGVMRWLRRVY